MEKHKHKCQHTNAELPEIGEGELCALKSLELDCESLEGVVMVLSCLVCCVVWSLCGSVSFFLFVCLCGIVWGVLFDVILCGIVVMLSCGVMLCCMVMALCGDGQFCLMGSGTCHRWRN